MGPLLALMRGALGILLALLLTTAGPALAQNDLQTVLSTIRGFYEAANEKAYDRFAEFASDEFAVNARTFFEHNHRIFPDLTVTPEHIYYDPAQRRVVVLERLTGTQGGYWEGHPPTNKRATWDAVAVYTLFNGGIRSNFFYLFNDDMIREQLGLSAAPPEAAAPETPPEVAGAEAVVASITLGRHPGIWIAANENAVWIPNSGEGTVSRIDPVTNEVVATIPTGGRPAGGWNGQDPTAVTSNGSEVWVSVNASRAVARIDPESNEVVETLPVEAQTYSLTVTDTDLWVVTLDDDAVLRIDLATKEEVARFNVPFPARVAVHGDSAWVTALRAGEVYRIDLATNEVTDTLKMLMVTTDVVASEGQVWVTHPANGRVSRIDPATNEVVASVELGGEPFGIAIGEEGVWVAGTAHGENENTLSLIDPATNQLVWVAPLPAWGQSVAVSGGAAWTNSPMDDRLSGYVYRVERQP
jgi:YVTN family beta-propeller protein